MVDQKYVDRPPRIQPELPVGIIEIPTPPAKEKQFQSYLQMALPVITIVGYLLISIFGRGRSLLMMIPMGISVLASVVFAYHSSRQNRKEQEAKEAAYTERLNELRREMVQQHDMQRRFYGYNFPEPTQVIEMALAASNVTANNHANGHKNVRLWERRTTDADFGIVRLGIGTLPSTVTYQLSQTGGNEADDPLMLSATRLAEDSRFVVDAPVTINLRQTQPKTGEGDNASLPQYAIGVVGQQAKAVYASMWAFTTHLAGFHAPTDMRLFILGLDRGEPYWQWASILPHCQSAKPHEVVCFEDDADRQVDKDASKVYRFLRALRRVLDERHIRLQDRDNHQDVTLPFLVVIVDLLGALPDDSRLKDLEMDPAMSLLLNQGPELGAAVIFLVSDANKVPSGCRAVIELSLEKSDQEIDLSTGPRVSFRYAEIGVNTPRYLGNADIIQRLELLEKFSQAVEPFSVRRSYGADLPRGVHMLDMLGVQTVEQLRQLTLENWSRSMQPAEAEWLNVKLGMLSGGDYRTLRFSADADGVHGLVAGSTGSGKSELLMTMILGLAYNYDPSIINFVLVDFKGGAAFEPFRKLPHCVDIVTNLRGSAVERMFAAITAELNRRQALNTITESKHIVDYRRRKLHEPDKNGQYGQPVTIKDKSFPTAPYPHLFVFIDEFAEMIAENPDYKAQLNSITRLGRALGVTLILAAQRPTGVTDQMRANIKFRISLRVETREESQEILRRPDAAYLPTGIPGRGYLQVGNENVEMIQVAWTGADYGEGQVTTDVIWLDEEGPDVSTRSSDELPKVFEVMVDMMAKLAAEHSLPQRKPWPDFLPDRMSLQTPFDPSYMNPEGLNFLLSLPGQENQKDTSASDIALNPLIDRWLSPDPPGWPGINWRQQALRAVVGIIDNPYNAEQLPLMVDLRRGHAVIFGASGWGKTTFLRTLLAALASSHSPKELHVYILDFGGRQMSLFRDLPHVGAIVTPDEDERLQRLLRRLDNMLEQRKKILSEAGADDVYAYNTAHPDGALPAILVLVDNFAEFKEGYDGLMPILVSLVRESRAYGIHFVAAADLPNAMSGKLYNLFTERMTLKLSDSTEYIGIVGRGARPIEDIAGRGFVKVERRALEFQAALPVGTSVELESQNETLALLRLISAISGYDNGIPNSLLPAEIYTLPSAVWLKDILPPTRPKHGRRAPRVRAAVGIDDLTLEPWHLNLYADGPHCLVIGPPNVGKTTFLRTLVLSLAYNYRPEEVMLVLIDFQERLFKYGGEHTLEDLPHVVQTMTNSDQIEAFVPCLQAEAQAISRNKKSNRAIIVVIDNYDSFSDDVTKKREIMPQLAILAREFGTSGLHFIIGGSPEIMRSQDELRKQVQVPHFGLALDVDSVDRLNGRVSRSLKEANLPLGRGFVVKSGRTSMVQFATPALEVERLEADLDTWVKDIADHYKGQKAVWSYQGESTGVSLDRVKSGEVPGQPVNIQSVAIPSGASTPSVATTRPGMPRSTVPPGVDVALLRQKIEEKGGFSIDFLQPTEVVDLAESMGLWQAGE